MKKENNQILRLLACSGLGVVFLYEIMSFPILDKKQGWLVLTLVFGISLVFCVLKIFKDEGTKIFGNLDLFVPLSFFIFFDKILYILDVGHSFNLGSFNLFTNFTSLGVQEWGVLFYILVTKTILAGWTSFIALRVSMNKSPGVYSSLITSIKHFPQILFIILIGEQIPFLLAGSIINYTNSITLIMISYFVICFTWSLLTITLLPYYIVERKNVLFAIGNSIKLSFLEIPKWLPIVCTLFLIFGIVTISLDSSESYLYPFEINYLWIGGYNSSFFWYYEILDYLGMDEIPLFSTFITIFFFILVLIVKLKIIDEVLIKKSEIDVVSFNNSNDRT